MAAKGKTKPKKDHVNEIIAGVTGAVIGAGVGIAGAMLLNDDKNRIKVKKVLNSLKDQAADYVKKLEEETQKETGVIEGEVLEGVKKTRKLISLSTKALKK